MSMQTMIPLVTNHLISQWKEASCSAASCFSCPLNCNAIINDPEGDLHTFEQL